MKNIKLYHRNFISEIRNKKGQFTIKVNIVLEIIKLQYHKIRQFIISKISNLIFKEIAKWFITKLLEDWIIDGVKTFGRWIWDFTMELIKNLF
jgi:hypothetical protein